MEVIRGEGGEGEEGEGTMPPDVPLADDDIDLIGRWIMEGARKD